MKYLITILFFFNILNTKSHFINFIESNQHFLDSPLKCIDFDYHSQNIDGLLDQGSGTLLIGSNIYKIILDQYIFLVKDNVLKRYNYKTNQIFIENSDPFLDSLIFNFFNINTIELDSSGRLINSSINVDRNSLTMNFLFSNDSTFIQSLDISYDTFKISFFNLKLDTKYPNAFQFDFPNAFKLDLRD